MFHFRSSYKFSSPVKYELLLNVGYYVYTTIHTHATSDSFSCFYFHRKTKVLRAEEYFPVNKCLESNLGKCRSTNKQNNRSPAQGKYYL